MRARDALVASSSSAAAGGGGGPPPPPADAPAPWSIGIIEGASAVDALAQMAADDMAVASSPARGPWPVDTEWMWRWKEEATPAVSVALNVRRTAI